MADALTPAGAPPTIGGVFILFGTRRTTTNIGRAMVGCQRCNQQAWFTFARTSRHFTLFFIPLIPLGSTTRAVCGTCGFAQTVPDATANQMLAAAQNPTQMHAGAPQKPTQGYGQPPQQQPYGQAPPQQQPHPGYGPPGQPPYGTPRR